MAVSSSQKYIKDATEFKYNITKQLIKLRESIRVGGKLVKDWVCTIFGNWNTGLEFISYDKKLTPTKKNPTQNNGIRED